MTEDKKDFSINDKTNISLKSVITLVGVVIWIIRLGDKVSALEKAISELQANKILSQKSQSKLDRRLYFIETKFHIKTTRDDYEE